MSKTAVKGIGALVAIVVVAVGFYLVRPLFVDTVVDEEFPMSSGAEVPDDMTAEEVEAEMEAAAAAPDVEEVEDMPATDGGDPTPLQTGTFVGADSFHEGSGTATVFELADGSRLLRLEDFSVTNGPDLHVYLAPVVDGVPQVNADAVDLGSLKGNIGNQNYDIPADLALDGEWGVVIWCQPFSVTFATAVLG